MCAALKWFTSDKDVVRHELVSRIIRAYENFDEEVWEEEKTSVFKASEERQTS